MQASPPPTGSDSDPASVAAACKAHALTPAQFAALRDEATAAKASAYCPYSRFRVGAALLADDGAVTTGANVENASYPVGTCAERVALAKAVTAPGGRPRAFRAVAVASDASPPASPCGMCRQLWVSLSPVSCLLSPVSCLLVPFPFPSARSLVPRSLGPAADGRSIREFCDPHVPVIMFGGDGGFVVLTLQEVRLGFFLPGLDRGVASAKRADVPSVRSSV
ncbi:cytidine deaminase [Metarhizium album ARSEF 1941]|uniref:Cytidine deaminase n=1 Tax=Metarhizium album (strain ARSEF 1941) TaxID=1081103 RepID=A0A0B2X2Y5_METAS|nr:cytidine deaminase [Metarhizium album ARSEF 1941]KHO00123.1 cytidine deaminase [Metarhizium album ARSEF 1941]